MISSSFSLEALHAQGFVGFIRFQDLDLNTVPKAEGIYVVLRSDDAPAVFLETSSGGRFKGRDPTVSIENLRSRWVDHASVLYIGKASLTKSTNLRRRLSAYRSFGLGAPIGHWGGRYVWQCSDWAEHLICWKQVEAGTARQAERELIARFSVEFGKQPFANILA